MEMDVDPFEVTSLASLARKGEWRVAEPHAAETALLYFVTRGQGRLTAGGRARGFSAPTLLYLPAATMHQFETSGPVIATCVRFPATLGPSLPDHIIFMRRIASGHQAELTHLIQALETELKDQTEGWRMAAESYGALLGVQVARLETTSEEEPWVAGKAVKIVSEYTGLIERDLRRPLIDAPSVSRYATRLGITPTHLNRVCQSVSGQAASTILQDRIVSEARRRLVDTKDPVQSIARSLGFRSPAYFSRAFGQRTGLTPSAARAASRAPDDPRTNR